MASRVVALRQAIAASEPANRAHQRALGQAFEREGERLANLGRYPDAMRSYRAASQVAETLLRGERTNVLYRADAARALARLGDMASQAGDVETAIQQFRSSLALQRQGLGRDTLSVAVRVATIDAQARLARSHARLQQTTEALAALARTESAMDGTRLDSSDVATRSAFGDTYVSLAESYLTLRGQGAADPLAAGICRKAGRMFDRAESLLADLLTRERATARDSSRLIASRSLRASAKTQCPAS
jgi:tetratricopeptide (TPR) repeat protein